MQLIVHGVGISPKKPTFASYHVILCCSQSLTQSIKFITLVEKVGNQKKKSVTSHALVNHPMPIIPSYIEVMRIQLT